MKIKELPGQHKHMPRLIFVGIKSNKKESLRAEIVFSDSAMVTLTTGASLTGLFSITKTLRLRESDKNLPSKLIMKTTQRKKRTMKKQRKKKKTC